jgi:hypothetical protein
MTRASKPVETLASGVTIANGASPVYSLDTGDALKALVVVIGDVGHEVFIKQGHGGELLGGGRVGGRAAGGAGLQQQRRVGHVLGERVAGVSGGVMSGRIRNPCRMAAKSCEGVG